MLCVYLGVSDDGSGDWKQQSVQTGPDRIDPGGWVLLTSPSSALPIGESPLLLWIAASRHSSTSEHTLCILEKLLAAPDGRLDVRPLERHLVDVIGIMEGLCLIQRKTAGHIQWM